MALSSKTVLLLAFMDEFSECPVSLFTWVELVVIELAPSDTLLENYDIYWGSGNEASIFVENSNN